MITKKKIKLLNELHIRFWTSNPQFCFCLSLSKFPLFCFQLIRFYYWPLFRLNGLFSFNLHKHNNTFFFDGLTTQLKLCSEYFFLTHKLLPMNLLFFTTVVRRLNTKKFHFSMPATSFIFYYPCCRYFTLLFVSLLIIHFRNNSTKTLKNIHICLIFRILFALFSWFVKWNIKLFFFLFH